MILSAIEIDKGITTHSKEIITLGVHKLGIFGSYSRNEQTEKSDLDFIVEFIPSKRNFDNFFELAELLEKIFLKKVDLLTIESLSPHIGPKILKEVKYFALTA